MPFSDIGVTANGVVLVGHPHENYDVEGSGTVVEELGHYGFHSWMK